MRKTMSYPKPLSEKTLHKMYVEADLNDEQSSFLHAFFLGAANLYGFISLSDLWDIYFNYQHLRKNMKLHKSDFIHFSSIARREELPYRIYEIDDVYSDEERKDLRRMIVNKEVLNDFHASNIFYHLYRIEDQRGDMSYYIPEDMSDFVEVKKEKEEIALENYLGNLKVSKHPLKDHLNCDNKNENSIGKKLKDVYFLSTFEQFQIRYYSPKDGKQSPLHKRALERVLKDTKGTENEKLVHNLKVYAQRANEFQNELQYLLNELTDCGVEFTEKQVNELLGYVMDFVNHIRLYSNRGWKPSEMMANSYNPFQKPVISFGPNIQKMFDDGTYDKQELIEELQKRGFGVNE